MQCPVVIILMSQKDYICLFFLKYPNSFRRWTFNPAVLTRVNTTASVTSSSADTSTPTQFAVGDLVQICCDVENMKILQRGHGEWADAMLPVSIFAHVHTLKYHFKFYCILFMPHLTIYSSLLDLGKNWSRATNLP